MKKIAMVALIAMTGDCKLLPGAQCLSDPDCPSGFECVGGSCVEADEECEADSCGDHGTCDDSSGAVTCRCGEGYGGDRCEACADGYDMEDERCMPIDGEFCLEDSCSFHGACDASSGTIECECDEGYDGYWCEACAEGWDLEGDVCVAAAGCVDLG